MRRYYHVVEPWTERYGVGAAFEAASTVPRHQYIIQGVDIHMGDVIRAICCGHREVITYEYDRPIGIGPEITGNPQEKDENSYLYKRRSRAVCLLDEWERIAATISRDRLLRVCVMNYFFHTAKAFRFESAFLFELLHL